jgi:hypothetical protein
MRTVFGMISLGLAMLAAPRARRARALRPPLAPQRCPGRGGVGRRDRFAPHFTPTVVSAWSHPGLSSLA